MDTKQFLGLDVGLKRTGIARASETARLAEPLRTVETTEVFQAFQKLLKQYDVAAVVVGLPRNLKGEETQQTSWVRDWVQHAKSRIELPFYWQDEALTSRIAQAEKEAHKRPHDIDALAAAVILQDFLDTPPAERVIC